MRTSALAVCAAFTVSSVAAQVDTAWVRRFDGSFDSTDMATAMTFGAGGVYVTGYSLDEDTVEDFFSFRREADGSEGWFRRFDGRGDTTSLPVALAVDSAGNCYVTGKTWLAGSRYDWMTAKHDSTSSVQWATYHDGTFHHNDEPRAIAVAPDGGIIVTGAAFGPTSNWDYTTIKYGAGGETLWVAHYNGTADDGDEAEAVALDTAGSIYVTGSSPGAGTNQDIVTVKYNQAGETLWVRRYVGTGGIGDEDKATCITVDPMQNVYVGGYTEGYGTGRDFIVIKYSGHGDTLWTRRFNGTGNDGDEVVGIGTDGRGRLYATGRSWGAGTFYDYLTVCCSPLGESLWAYRWDVGIGGNEPRGLAVDPAGNTYVTGCGFRAATSYDIHTVSISPDGNLRWHISYDNPLKNDWDEPVGIALDGEGNVYVAGFSMGRTTDYDYVTIKYTQTPAIEEAQNTEVRLAGPPTIVRSMLLLPSGPPALGGSLVTADGRKVKDLGPGPNDVSRLAPGVCFVCHASGVDKVVLTK